MYENVFQFNSRPFTATPYVKHYFAGDAIHQALGQARVCIDRGSGPVIVVGGTGTGKSLMLAMLEEQYQSQFNVVNLGCARLDQRRELLQSILYELQLPYKDQSETELRFALIDYLKPSEKCPNGILLLVDEAHSLSADLLDEIRLIINFVRDGQPRVRLVMAGSQRLEENLSSPKLESLNQRIAARCYLSTMSRDETARYVTEHIDRVGGVGSELFSDEGLRAIHDVSDGCPRLINQVCDHALILAGTRGMNVVSGDCIQEAWADVQSIPGAFKSSSGESSTSVSSVKDDDSWTVIEFGQLDDDEAESEGVCYEFDSVSEAPADENLELIDEIDEACAASVGESEIESDRIRETSEELMHEPVSDSDDSDLDEEHADEELDEALAAAEFQREAETELENQAAIDAETAIAAAEIESQLAAVFGNEPQWEESTTIDDLELEQDQILEQVDVEKASLFGADDGLVVSESEAEMESDEVISEDQLHEEPPESNSKIQVDVISGASIDEEENRDAAALAMEDEPDLEPAHVEAVEAVADTAHEPQDDVDDSQPYSEQPASVPFDDPFNESFEEEENLIDRYAPFVAHQNQSALSITSSDLASLTPMDELEDAVNLRSDEGEQDQDQVREAFVQVASDGSLDSDDSQEEPIVSNESLSDDENELDNALAESLSSFQAALQSELDDSEPELSMEVDDELESAFENELGDDVVAEETKEEGGFHVHVTEASSQDVRNKAEEILKRLNVSREVSCETPLEQGSETPSVEMDPEAVEAQSHESEVDPKRPKRVPHVSLDDPDFEKQNQALDESQQILNEILDHKNALAKQREATTARTSFDESDSDTAEAKSRIRFDQNQGDDREMIIVNRMEEPSESSDPAKEAPIPFPTTPVSTGRAERMDYQKLFDQLRDVSNRPE